MHTGFLSEIGTKLRDWAVGQAGGSCYSRAALSSNDSKTLYIFHLQVRNVENEHQLSRTAFRNGFQFSFSPIDDGGRLL